MVEAAWKLVFVWFVRTCPFLIGMRHYNNLWKHINKWQWNLRIHQLWHGLGKVQYTCIYYNYDITRKMNRCYGKVKTECEGDHEWSDLPKKQSMRCQLLSWLHDLKSGCHLFFVREGATIKVQFGMSWPNDLECHGQSRLYTGTYFHVIYTWWYSYFSVFLFVALLG